MAETPCDRFAPGDSRYLPIADHGLIGDLRTVARGDERHHRLVLLPGLRPPERLRVDPGRGAGRLLRADGHRAGRTKQFYFPDTNVLITRFFTEDGVGEVQDFMPVGTGCVEADRHRLIRRVLCVRGSLPFRARIAPRFGYGAQPHTLRLLGDVAVFESADLSLALTATMPLEGDDSDVWADFKLSEGESAVFSLDQVDDSLPPRMCARAEAERQFATTVAYWRHWLAASRYRGRWRRWCTAPPSR